jgi:high-affinity Fe2+/Pb2+ permease
MDKELILIIIAGLVYGSWLMFKDYQAKKIRQNKLNRIKFN